MSGSRIRAAAALALLGAWLPAVAPGPQGRAPDVRLENETFEWVDVTAEDTAVYRWSVEVVNETDQTYGVQVVLELLDDDDRVVHRDAVAVTVEAGQRRAIERQGQLPYDDAAEVVSYRHRRELSSPPGRRR